MEPVTISHEHTTFLSGPAGAGKTTLAVAHLRALLKAGVPGDSILVMAPQRSLLRPYQAELQRPDLPPGSLVETLTLGGLARRLTSLFWPAVAEAAGFARPQSPPTFLTLETAQYYMRRVVTPLVAQAGYFDDIHVQPSRLYSQILDNLNKAAVVGFSHLEIGQRLRGAWSGSPARVGVFSQVQDCAVRFRQFCLQNNLLDFSLQIEVLSHQLLTAGWFRAYLFGRYQHLIADNVEEDTPVTHDLLRDWLAACRSALLIYDTQAGFRRFLGADPEGGLLLRAVCGQHIERSQSYVTSPALEALATEMSQSLARHVGHPPGSAPSTTPTPTTAPAPAGNIRQALGYGGGRFHPQALDWVSDEIARLVYQEGIPAGEIVVLAPYLSDALRFALSDRLAHAGLQAHSHRPSRALNEEPAARSLLVWAALAHPDWGVRPAQSDVAHALTLALDSLDPARAHLLAQRAYAPATTHAGTVPSREGAAPTLPLRSFDGLTSALQERIGFEMGQRYETLRTWLTERLAGPGLPLDHFLSRLFGEVLSQPGFAFHRNLDSGRVAAGLITSARKFRQVVSAVQEDMAAKEGAAHQNSIGRAYTEMVHSGVIAAEYGLSNAGLPEAAQAETVLLAPAYTFLLSNRPVEIQFWLNASSSGWWERLYQPLTHPYVLTRAWPGGQQWTDEDEQMARVATLDHLIQGLMRRCRRKVYLVFSTLNEQGFEERGPLLSVAQQVLRRLPANEWELAHPPANNGDKHAQPPEA